jgi:hypothetical protein
VCKPGSCVSDMAQSLRGEASTDLSRSHVLALGISGAEGCMEGDGRGREMEGNVFPIIPLAQANIMSEPNCPGESTWSMN